MNRIIINDARTKEVFKGKKCVSEIHPAVFQGYVNIISDDTCTVVVLEINEVNGVPVVIAEAYPEDAAEGTLAGIEHFPFTDSTTIEELLQSVSVWVRKPQVSV